MPLPNAPSLRTALVLAALGVTACGRPTAPDGPRLVVEVTDGARPVTRTRILVAPVGASDAPDLSALTRDDGSAAVAVPSAGEYRVRVVPRAGYRSGAEPLARTVTLAGSGAVTLRFVVVAEGSTAPVVPEHPGN